MSEPSTYSFTRYLEAKQTVDNRALNHDVLQRFKEQLVQRTEPLRILELGVGIGAMIDRVLDWECFPAAVEYTAVDVDPTVIETACRRLASHRYLSTGQDCTNNECFVFEHNGTTLTVSLETSDVFAFLEDTDQTWDVLIAKAFLDLTDVSHALAELSTVLTVDGLAYFPITFDGGTTFVPPVDSNLDNRIEQQYHRYMEISSRGTGKKGDYQAGRHVLQFAPDVGWEILAARASDWVVFPQEDGYVADEAYFLHHIIETIRQALTEMPAICDGTVETWSDQRHQHIDNQILIYIAHQLDILCRV